AVAVLTADTGIQASIRIQRLQPGQAGVPVRVAALGARSGGIGCSRRRRAPIETEPTTADAEAGTGEAAAGEIVAALGVHAGRPMIAVAIVAQCGGIDTIAQPLVVELQTDVH